MKISFAVCAALAMCAFACDRGATPAGYLARRSRLPEPTPSAAPAPMGEAQLKTAADALEPSEAGGDDSVADSVSVDAQQIAPSMLIRTAEASVEVGAIDSGLAGVRALAQRVGGYVADESVQKGGDQPHTATLQVRIPAARFDDALAGLRPLGKVESVNVSTADVGEEFVDVNARMDNARKLESRLIALLATRTGKLSDVLDVERELSRVREGIERYEGRIRYLRTRAAVSTISVTVHEPLPVVGERGSGSELAEAFRQAWRNFVQFLAQSIAALGVLVPLGVIVVAAWVIARRLGIKRVRDRREPPQATADA
ncbi:MAG: DUF4349 domain-containing protein [Gemmatimonadaceae bacterium]